MGLLVLESNHVNSNMVDYRPGQEGTMTGREDQGSIVVTRGVSPEVTYTSSHYNRLEGTRLTVREVLRQCARRI